MKPIVTTQERRIRLDYLLDLLCERFTAAGDLTLIVYRQAMLATSARWVLR